MQQKSLVHRQIAQQLHIALRLDPVPNQDRDGPYEDEHANESNRMAGDCVINTLNTCNGTSWRSTVESSLPATFLYQCKHRVDRGRRDLDEAAHFLDGGDECIDLEGSTSLRPLLTSPRESNAGIVDPLAVAGFRHQSAHRPPRPNLTRRHRVRVH